MTTIDHLNPPTGHMADNVVGFARALRAALAPDGLNLLQANGAAAFQSVPHFHLHLIPRWNGDGKGFDWKPVPGDRTRIQAAAEKIRAAIS